MPMACSSARAPQAGGVRLRHQLTPRRLPRPGRSAARPRLRAASANKAMPVLAAGGIEALIFDCDGVILDSEDLHRRAYNLAFENFKVRCPGERGSVDWTEEFYCMLQNTVGGGKPKMRWYFNKNGWPSSSILDGQGPRSEDEQTYLIDTLQDYKTSQYKALIASGTVHPRPGVLRLMDQAQAAGIRTAICSAATKTSVEFVCAQLLGAERVARLDCFLAGDDVKEKKPSPLIYETAAQRMGIVNKRACVVVEDSLIGLKAALSAGMRCVITYTASTAGEDFAGAERVFPDMGEDSNPNLVLDDIVAIVA